MGQFQAGFKQIATAKDKQKFIGPLYARVLTSYKSTIQKQIKQITKKWHKLIIKKTKNLKNKLQIKMTIETNNK